ncbi:hypothetical protein S7711_09940 [Stachybotrys chartarum IBT 7711]|uniref:LysM domain-containing protein n=1 Tax=Stachybotrys chartarum (strain CBS 109288 / IBT 7711) TaxID=1280523 RepID=A0A084AU55_STACB|nr:hypothetical protein S7711_09940 [Stachybotrys chartarum IBT 7711]
MSLMKLFLLLTAQLALGAVTIYNITEPVDGLSSTCIGVLNQAVNCHESLRSAGKDGRFESDQTLSSLCTSTCSTALSTFVRRIGQTCSNARIVDGEYSYHIAYGAQLFIERYNRVCLKNTSGQFCNAVIRDDFNIDTVSQVITEEPGNAAVILAKITSTPNSDRDLRRLLLVRHEDTTRNATFLQQGTFFIILKNNIVMREDDLDAFDTKHSKGLLHLNPAIPTCDGFKYTVEPGDTCLSVAESNGVSTSKFLARNNVNCGQFPTSGSLCIPDNIKCNTHKVAESDTCSSISKTYKATWSQLISWNPEIGTYCDRLSRLASMGYSICVSNPGGDWENPFPDNEPGPTTTTTTTETHFTIPSTAFTSGHAPTRDMSYPNIAWVPAYANDTLQNCDVDMSPPVVYNYSVEYSCEMAARVYRVSLDDFMTWNPSLRNQSADGCQLDPSQRYCAQKVRLEPEGGSTPYCVQHEFVAPGTFKSNCSEFLDLYRVDEDSFGEWNSDTTCETFDTGYNYCVAVRNFRPAGQISTCNYWAMANDTSVTDPCSLYISKFGITRGRLLAWNPLLGSDCSGMKKYYDYCIGTPSWGPSQG